MIAETAGGTAALDSATRELTRVVVLFSLTGRLLDRSGFGRLAPHPKPGEAVLPVPVPVPVPRSPDGS